MTNVSIEKAKFPRGSALVGWVTAIVTRFTRANELRGINRAEFEQIARDLISPASGALWALTGRRVSADALECLAAEFEASPQLAKRLRAIERPHRAAQIRASMPIGPSCC